MEKLFEKNSFLTTFTALVEDCVPGKQGWEITLNQTAFYPEGGGQPWDTGTLGNVTVQEVRLKNGRVVHFCDGPLEVGAEVSGQLDWARRFDLMQQHSGEHIVSGLAHQLYGCDNVGFHLGAESVTIDLNVLLDEASLLELEEAANRYIWEDHPIEVLYPTREELAHIPYRSKKEIDGQVRLTRFPGADCCACCGTHVRSSGQVGLVKLLSVVRFREGVRIELLCGQRAFRYLARQEGQNRQVSSLLSAKADATAAAVQRLLEENAALKLRAAQLEEGRFTQIASYYKGMEQVLHFEEGLSPDGLRRLCDKLLEVCRGRCVVCSGGDGQGYKYAMGHRGGDLRALTKSFNQACGGRGGGKPEFVQGSVQAVRADIEGFFGNSEA